MTDTELEVVIDVSSVLLDESGMYVAIVKIIFHTVCLVA